MDTQSKLVRDIMGRQAEQEATRKTGRWVDKEEEGTKFSKFKFIDCFLIILLY